MPNTKKPRKAYKPKLILPPAIRLTDTHADQLALQMHTAARALDTEQGLKRYIDLLTKCVVAMEHSKSHDNHSRAILRTALDKLQKSIDSGLLHENDEIYLQKTAGFIDTWISNGRLSYASLEYAKRTMRAVA